MNNEEFEKILSDILACFVENRYFSGVCGEVKKLFHQAGMEVIGEKEEYNRFDTGENDEWISGRNNLRDEELERLNKITE